MDQVPDEAALRAWALSYLARYATSRSRLAAHLRRRALRGRAEGKADPALEAAIARVVARCVELGLVDDRAHARARLRRLIQRGASDRRLAADLAARGISAAMVREELEALAEELGEAPERVAARSLLRRRGLLPASGGKLTCAQRQRALAALARAGFSLAVAREILGTEAAVAAPAEDEDEGSLS